MLQVLSLTKQRVQLLLVLLNMALEKRVVHTFDVLAAVGIILLERVIRDGVSYLLAAAKNHTGGVV